MRVFVFGAGVSKPAGMPLGASLGRALRRFIGRSHSPNREQLVSNWTKLRQRGIFEEDFELSLTRLDVEHQALFRRARQQKDVDVNDAVTLRGELAQLLDDYFAERHAHILQESTHSEYFRRFIRNHVLPGDTFLTLNYDCLLERALRDEGLWSLADGYGLDLTPVYTELVGMEPPSACKVYKLHGSAGWLTAVGPPGAKYGGPHELLIRDHVLIALGYGPLVFSGERAVAHQAVLPSYIKRLGLYPLPCIWKRAVESLGRAEITVVSGYSFPEADSAVRGLLLSGIPRGERLAYCWYDQSNAGVRRVESVLNFFREGGIDCRDRRASIGQLSRTRDLVTFIYSPLGSVRRRRVSPGERLARPPTGRNEGSS